MAELILTDEEVVETGGGDYPTIPEDTVLEAKILDVEVKDSFFWLDPDDHSKGKQKQVSFKFQVTEDGPYRNTYVWGDTPTVFSSQPNCKLRLWVEEIFGVDEGLPLDFKLDTEDLVDASVRIVIGNYWSKKKEKYQHNVSDVMRMPSGRTPENDAF